MDIQQIVGLSLAVLGLGVVYYHVNIAISIRVSKIKDSLLGEDKTDG